MKVKDRRILVIAVTGAVLAHGAVFLLSAANKAHEVFTFGFTDRGEYGSAITETSETGVMRLELPGFANPLPAEPEEEEKLLIPLAPVPPEKKEKPYFRTTQNEREEKSPLESDFISDRNTTGASELAPRPDAELPLPTLDGRDDERFGFELKDRDYRDGEIGDDSSVPTVASVASPPVPPSPPNSILKKPEQPETLTKPEESKEKSEPEGELTETEKTDDPTDPEAKEEKTLAEEGENKEEPVNPLEEKIEQTAPVENLTPPSNFAELAGGEDIFPLPEKPEEVPSEELPRNVEVPEPAEMVRPPESTPKPEVRKAEIYVPETPTPQVLPSPPTLPSIPLPGDPSSTTPNTFQPHTVKRKVSGMISNKGKPAVSADETAVGKYHKMVNGIINRRWNLLRRQKADFVDYGSLRVRFYVNPDGRTQNVRVLSGDANPIMTDFTLEAIVGAKVEPMPPEVLSELALANGLLEITYNVLIY